MRFCPVFNGETPERKLARQQKLKQKDKKNTKKHISDKRVTRLKNIRKPLPPTTNNYNMYFFFLLFLNVIFQSRVLKYVDHFKRTEWLFSVILSTCGFVVRVTLKSEILCDH